MSNSVRSFAEGCTREASGEGAGVILAVCLRKHFLLRWPPRIPPNEELLKHFVSHKRACVFFFLVVGSGVASWHVWRIPIRLQLSN